MLSPGREGQLLWPTGRTAATKEFRWYTTLAFSAAKLRAPCLNALSARSAPKAYRERGDKDRRATCSKLGAVRKAVVHQGDLSKSWRIITEQNWGNWSNWMILLLSKPVTFPSFVCKPHHFPEVRCMTQAHLALFSSSLVSWRLQDFHSGSLFRK